MKKLFFGAFFLGYLLAALPVRADIFSTLSIITEGRAIINTAR